MATPVDALAQQRPAAPPSAPAAEPSEAPAAPSTPSPAGASAPSPTGTGTAPTPPPESHVRPAPPPAPVVRHVTTPVIVSGIVAGAALVSGVVFAVNATSEHSKYEEQPNHAVGLAGERSAFIADVSFGVAALFGLTAIALYMLPDEPAPTEPAKAAQSGRANWFTSALKGEVLRF